MKRVRQVKDLSAFKRFLNRHDLVVDAVFGIGFRGRLGIFHSRLFDAINASGKRIVSLDVPSGLDATTGEVWGSCIKAETTVAFGCAKKGYFLKRGPCVAGKIKVVDISLPRSLLRKLLNKAPGAQRMLWGRGP